jgi:phosphoribosylformimino-5-aminoimidazole carboxamide ribotide isomerase
MSKIIPAIDLINGKCVRLTEGDYNSEKVYFTNPLEVAQDFEAKGAKRLHIIDLDAAKSGTSHNLKIINSIIRKTSLKVQVGGGLKKTEQISKLLDIGADRIIVGSKAQRDRSGTIKWIEKFGSDKIIIGADVRNGKIAINGWLDTSKDNISEFIFYYSSHGANLFLCTDILKDGKLEGPSTQLYNSLLQKFPEISLIASGGVSSEEDIKILVHSGVSDIVVGKAIYEGKINISQILNKY